MIGRYCDTVSATNNVLKVGVRQMFSRVIFLQWVIPTKQFSSVIFHVLLSHCDWDLY